MSGSPVTGRVVVRLGASSSPARRRVARIRRGRTGGPPGWGCASMSGAGRGGSLSLARLITHRSGGERRTALVGVVWLRARKRSSKGNRRSAFPGWYKPTSPARAAATQARALRRDDSRSASTLAVPGRGTAVAVEVARRKGLTFGQMKYGVTQPAASSRSLYVSGRPPGPGSLLRLAVELRPEESRYAEICITSFMWIARLCGSADPGGER